MRARVRARGRTENNFTFRDKQKMNSHAPIVTAKKRTTPRLQGKHTETARSVPWFGENVGHIREEFGHFRENLRHIREKVGHFGRKVGHFRES